MLPFLLGCVTIFLIHQLLMNTTTRKPVVAVILLILFGYSLKVGIEAANSTEARSRLKQAATQTDVALAGRRVARAATLDMMQEYWVRGTGVGSFRLIFPLYQQKYPAIFNENGIRQV